MSEGRNESSLRTAIRHACNCACAENGCNTPDFILAEYLVECLKVFDKAVNRREEWYGREVNRLQGAFDETPIDPEGFPVAAPPQHVTEGGAKP